MILKDLLFVGLAAVPLAPGFSAPADAPALALPEYVTAAPRVANPAPVGSLAMPVSALRFEPLVDVQGRNLAEGQADVIIRGGIFENTGFRLGAVTLLDPQTGHYFAEIPIAPAMLSGPRVMTGADNAVFGFNSTVGTVAYEWRPVRTGGELSAGFGSHGLNRQSLYYGREWGVGPARSRTLAFDLDVSRSEADGTRPGGDHRFGRFSGRAQYRGEDFQTDLVYGYQAKFFGWPNLYTPFDVLETENLQTNLVVLNHRVTGSGGSFLQASAYFRRHKDDYEFDRTRPGIFNPYEHEGRVWGGGIEGRRKLAGMDWNFRLEGAADDLESTALTFGDFHSRRSLKALLLPEKTWEPAGEGQLVVRAGGSWDVSNRESNAVSPIGEVAWHFRDGADRAQRVYLQYAAATQVPGYTALNSAPASGLFRGNPNLGRETSRNLEAGWSAGDRAQMIQAAVFYRRDRELTDWTFQEGVSARTANPVDIDCWGLEAVWSRSWGGATLTLGYTWLGKDADYRSAQVDASFYALNYARHRLTAALIYPLAPGLELRLDNEARSQAGNALRGSGDRALLSAAGLYFVPRGMDRLEVALMADNLWNSTFEEVPAVPPSRRQIALGGAWRW